MKSFKIFIKEFVQAIRDSNKYYVPIIQSDTWLLVVLWVGCELSRHYFLLMTHINPDSEMITVLAACGDFTISTLAYVVFSLLAPLRVMEIEKGRAISGFWAFSQKHVVPITAESIRALGVTILWYVIFIIPAFILGALILPKDTGLKPWQSGDLFGLTMFLVLGLIGLGPGTFKYMRLSFVPYVVVADEAYEKGERNALKYSSDLIKGVTLPLFILFILLLGIDFYQAKLREMYPVGSAPIMALAISLPFFLLNLYSNILLFQVYQLRVKALVARSSP